ncbi:MAG: dual specificity protein phosphatase family protein [Chloroflexales bacterium]|nr:dual specificity protein phosphatase family protein [Chloroflexales bacterium]
MILRRVSAWLAQRISNPVHGFAAAAPDEPTVFGARRPGFPFPVVSTATVNDWMTFMQAQQIRRIVCLLPQRQLVGYDHLLETYAQRFGKHNLCWAPIEDFQLADVATLTQVILPFLAAADRSGERVVVHCSAGIGRTGQVLAAWLVGFRGMSNAAALATVRQSGRNAYESSDPRLEQLLDQCRSTASFHIRPNATE